MDELLIKRYEVPNIMLDDEPIIKNVIGRDIHWKEDGSLTYRYFNKNQRPKSGWRRAAGGEKDTCQEREKNGKTIHLEMKSSSHEEMKE